jgi:hypothetical protein
MVSCFASIAEIAVNAPHPTRRCRDASSTHHTFLSMEFFTTVLCLLLLTAWVTACIFATCAFLGAWLVNMQDRTFASRSRGLKKYVFYFLSGFEMVLSKVVVTVSVAKTYMLYSDFSAAAAAAAASSYTSTGTSAVRQEPPSRPVPPSRSVIQDCITDDDAAATTEAVTEAVTETVTEAVTETVKSDGNGNGNGIGIGKRRTRAKAQPPSF